MIGEPNKKDKTHKGMKKINALGMIVLKNALLHRIRTFLGIEASMAGQPQFGQTLVPSWSACRQFAQSTGRSPDNADGEIRQNPGKL
jgi:hypothetical protein